MGKGSTQRPTDKVAFDSGYERIFGQQAKSEAALPAMVDFSQEHLLYDLFEDVIVKLRYETLTRAEQHHQLERVVAAEREACARLCEIHYPQYGDYYSEAIRNRGAAQI